MTRYEKIHHLIKEKTTKKKNSKNKDLNREGYGYIKRRVGLLSNEIKAPTYITPKEPH